MANVRYSRFVCYHRPAASGLAWISTRSEEKALQRSAFPGKDAILSSVIQLQSELDLARIVWSIARRSDFSKIGISEIGCPRNCDNAVPSKSRIIEVRVVENIEELSAELQQETFGESHVLEGREVQALEGHSDNLRRRTPQS